MKPIIAIPATAALVYRAYSRKSLTKLGIIFATLTAVVHALHPWSVFFALLVTFFLCGTAVTKIKHDVKARLTSSATGSPGGEGARTHVQVLANSIVASVLILLHIQRMKDARNESEDLCAKIAYDDCKYAAYADPLIAGIIANYAAVSADTFSSELGILAKGPPRLITNLARIVPPGTNGGVTAYGTTAGLVGSCIASGVAVLLLPDLYRKSTVFQSSANNTEPLPPISRMYLFLFFSFAGFAGTILDSLLGAAFQASVVDVRTGKVIEGEGGGKVIVRSNTATTTATDNSEKTSGKRQNLSGDEYKEATGSKPRESRQVESGRDVLDNNAVNLLMAGVVSFGAILVASIFW